MTSINRSNFIRYYNKLTEYDRIDANPFNTTYLQVQNEKKSIKKAAKSILKLDILKKKIIKATTNNYTEKKSNILENIQILSPYELIKTTIDYFVFPHTQFSTYNTVSSLYNYFPNALKAAFENYISFHKFFYVKLNDGLIKFETKICMTENLVSLLKEHDILFIKENQDIIITDTPNMVMDMLGNIKISNLATLPIIVSREQFEYSIYRIFRLNPPKIIKINSKQNYYYKTTGIVYLEDLSLSPDTIINS